MHTPIHTGIIAGKPVRFFRTPLNDGRPDFPWHAVDDLMAACNLDRQRRRHFLRMMQKDHPGTMRTIATPNGIVTVAPHFQAQGLVDAMIHVGCASSTARRDYDTAIFEAGEKDQPEASFEYTIAAFHRWSDEKTA